MGCFGTAIAIIICSFSSQPLSLTFWVVEVIVFSVFLIGGLVHGRLKWKRYEIREWETHTREELRLARVRHETSDPLGLAERKQFYDGLDASVLDALELPDSGLSLTDAYDKEGEKGVGRHIVEPICAGEED